MTLTVEINCVNVKNS